MDSNFSHILEILFKKTGYDFRGYRETTLQRRIARRLHATGCPTHGVYLDYLSTHPEEYSKLLGDLTVRVTEFFREPDIWQTIAKMVVPKLLEKEVRIWSAGCATGEETYSLAILMEEAKKKSLPLVSCFSASILGTDLDQDALNRARQGIYAEEKLKSLPSPLQDKYFHPVENGYQIASEIRGHVSFQRTDLVRGEAPGEFDLIACRNVLIYFSKELQEKVLLKFYHALHPGGFLWLGKAESLWGRPQELFECVDKGAKSFRKRVAGD